MVDGGSTTHDPAQYGERFADIYDERYASKLNTAAAVDFLAELASGGRALELGIGTGRVALPLAARGVSVVGIDASPAMIERLRAKPGASDIEVVIGDFADVNVSGHFSLIYVPFNTFFALLSRADQVRCFRNVAAHLAPGGSFVIEAFVPDLVRYRDGNQILRAMDVGASEIIVAATRHDPVEQRLESQHVVISEAGIRMYPISTRYAWPAELDLMAALAGLTLADRHAGYDRQPFTAAAKQHVSVYR